MTDTLILSPDDPENAMAAIREAAVRLIERGMPLWSLEELTVANLTHKYPGCEFLSFWFAEKLVGGVIITTQAPAYWPPEILEQSSIYISKLSVMDEYVGRNISAKMMDLIHEHYANLGFRFAGLDCDADRPKLNKIYLDMGYQLIHCRVVWDRYPTYFYQRAI